MEDDSKLGRVMVDRILESPSSVIIIEYKLD